MKGRYLSFTAIISCLKGERIEENERIAKWARLEYGDSFTSFSPIARDLAISS